MKRQIRMLTGVAILLAAVAASGQLSHQAQATVPFDFIAGGRSSHAGKYWIQIDRTRDLVTLRSSEAKTMFLLTTRSSQPEDTRSYLRFRRYGDQWFLEEVASDGVAQSVHVTRPERVVMAGNTRQKPIIADIAMH